MAQELHLVNDTWNSVPVQCFAMPPNPTLLSSASNHMSISSPLQPPDSYADVDAALVIAAGRLSTPSSSSSSCSSSSSSSTAAPSYHQMSVSNAAASSSSAQPSPGNSNHFMGMCEYTQPLPTLPVTTTGSSINPSNATYPMMDYASTDFSVQACTNDYHPSSAEYPSADFISTDYHHQPHPHHLPSHHHHHPLLSSAYPPPPSHLHASPISYDVSSHSHTHHLNQATAHLPLHHHDPSNMHSVPSSNVAMSSSMNHAHPLQSLHHPRTLQHPNGLSSMPLIPIEYAPTELKPVDPLVSSHNYHPLSTMKDVTTAPSNSSASSSSVSSSDSLLNDRCTLMPPPPPSLLTANHHSNNSFLDPTSFHAYNRHSNSLLQMPNSSMQTMQHTSSHGPSIQSNGGPPRLNSPMVDDALTSLSWLQNLNMCMTRLGAPTPPASPIYSSAIGSTIGSLLQPVLGHPSKPRAERKIGKEGKLHKSPKMSQNSSSINSGVSLLASNHSQLVGTSNGNTSSAANLSAPPQTENVLTDHDLLMQDSSSLLNGACSSLNASPAASTTIVAKRNKSAGNKKSRSSSGVSNAKKRQSQTNESISEVNDSGTSSKLSSTLSAIVEATLSTGELDIANPECKPSGTRSNDTDLDGHDATTFDGQTLSVSTAISVAMSTEDVPPEDPVDYEKDATIKPPFSYATLICMAMRANRNKMTLRAIYKWIRENFLYYQNADPSWQVRSNSSCCCDQDLAVEECDRGLAKRLMIIW
jgi:hypothetical protein